MDRFPVHESCTTLIFVTLLITSFSEILYKTCIFIIKEL